VLWVGSDDGLVHVSNDGGAHWRNVTPPGLTPWSHVTGIEASHADPRTAYVAIDRHRLDDDRPYLYVTRDAGRTWRETHAGIPDGSFLNAIREDPARRGLLYAATETGVFVSFDDAASWQSLRLNMPVVSVRDISVRDGDLAIATHGRAFWILDDVEPLRELAANAASGARLFAPRDAVRTREGNDEAEAIPPEIPAGDNPPIRRPRPTRRKSTFRRSGSRARASYPPRPARCTGSSGISTRATSAVRWPRRAAIACV